MFSKNDVCVVLYNNRIIPLEVGDIAVVESDIELWDEVLVRVNKVRFVFIHPLFLEKIGVL